MGTQTLSILALVIQGLYWQEQALGSETDPAAHAGSAPHATLGRANLSGPQFLPRFRALLLGPLDRKSVV